MTHKCVVLMTFVDTAVWLSAPSSSFIRHSSKMSSALTSPRSFRSNRAGPGGGPTVKSNGENGCSTQRLSRVLTRDKQTYAALREATDTLLLVSCASTKAASSVAPWIMCAVEPKSGRIQKLVLRASIPVYLLTIQVRERGLKGYTPLSKLPIFQSASANCM